MYLYISLTNGNILIENIPRIPMANSSHLYIFKGELESESFPKNRLPIPKPAIKEDKTAAIAMESEPKINLKLLSHIISYEIAQKPLMKRNDINI